MFTAAALVVTLAFPSAASRFRQHWSDGKAELSGYELVQPRYGEQRRGTAVLVFVTEPYSRSRHVKVDRYDSGNPDHLVALKLNHVRKFQTGIYDYSVMTSVFVDPAADFAPLKVTFTSQEWCGHVFEDARFGPQSMVDVRSYFEGETQATVLPAGVESEDALFIRLRSLGAEALARETRTVKLLGSALQRRLKHQPTAAFESTLGWSPTTTTVETRSGPVKGHSVAYTRQDGSSCVVHVEVDYPRRILGWSCSDGESARLLDTTRLPYWQTHKEGDERLLEKLGFESAQQPGTPGR